MKNLIIEMEEYASEHNVPIIEKESIAFIMKYIKAHNIKNVLEIGSAIGYSAILMASSTQDVTVTTIERDNARYMECLKSKAGGVIPVTIGVSKGTRDGYVYDYLDILISAILDAGYEIVPARDFIQ